MKHRSRFSKTELVVGCLVAGLLLMGAGTVGADLLNSRAAKVKAVSNVRQVILGLRIYSADNSGSYPTGATSNAALRQLFVEGVLEHEVIFGCPESPYRPDGNIGKAPDFAAALSAGENHWAMTHGLSDSATGSIPLIYENPSKAEWPPKWNTTTAGRQGKGRAWSDGAVIIGLNDSSVKAFKLEVRDGDAVPLAPGEEGSAVFAPQQAADIKVLDIEVPPVK